MVNEEYIEAPNFFKLEDPYCDFGFIKTKFNIQQQQFKICSEERLCFNKIICPDNTNGYLIGGKEPTIYEENKIIFSGIAKGKDRLIVGQKDILNKNNIDEIIDSVGTFTAYYGNQKQIKFISDYYSMGRFFLFQNDDFFIISNRYHLLLLIIKDLKISMEIDWEQVIASLCLTPGCTPMLSQHFNRHMVVKNCIRLPIDKMIVIDNQGVKFQESTIGNDLKKREILGDEEYKKLIKQAANEIVENINIVLESKHFDRVVVDLTSGLDSRIMYAALTNIDENLNKVEISTGGSEEKFAIPINNLYKFPYTTMSPKSKYSFSCNEVLEYLRSYYIGLEEVLINIYPEKKNYKKVINLAGGCGEVFRPYFSKHIPEKERKYLVDMGVKSLVERTKGKFLTNYETTSKSLYSVLLKEFNQIPGDNWGEVVDNFYIYYRNSYMFNNEYMSTMNILRWHPLQSKTMFRLRQNNKNLNLSFDLLNELNPLITNIPYNHNEYNIYIKEYREKILPVDPFVKNLQIPLNFDASEFQKSLKEKNEKEKSVCKQNRKKTIYLKDILQMMKINVKQMIKFLHIVLGEDNSKFFGINGIEKYIEEKKDNMLAMRYIWSTLSSVVDQIVITLFSNESIKNTIKSNVKKKPLKIIFTIDTEHKRGNEPVLMTGDLSKYGFQENFGPKRIMSEFENRNMKAVFFVNVYEAGNADLEWKNYVEDTLKEIHSRGHEVALHYHPIANRLDCFPNAKKTMDRQSLQEQVENIKDGIRFIEKIVGTRPISFRGGAYKITDDTFKALTACGIKYDSSCWYGREENKLSKYRAISQVHQIEGIIEFPVIPAYTSTGRLEKLDIDGLSANDIIEVFEEAREREDFPYIQLMFHSFTLLTQKPGEKFNKILVDCGNKKIYGPNYEKINRLETVLDYLENNPNYEVCTFRDLDKEGIRIPSMRSDGIFAGVSKKAKDNASHFNKLNYYDFKLDKVVKS